MSNSATRAADLLKVLSRLTEVLQQEIHLLRAMKPSEMQSLQHDKIILTAAYEAMIGELRGNPKLLEGLEAGLREQVVQAATRFQHVLSDNARALFAVREANDRLFKAVVRAVEDKRNEARGYAAGGSFAPLAGAVAAEPVSLSVDQRL